ncbi:MAG: hypothetical protein O3A53_03685 [Acidobacteria bacterium]|nr:hypothetical protein [Acidobacteriota bacterium]MDA1233883.1 hypothetical protein [Acidobacteriota bacterium]
MGSGEDLKSIDFHLFPNASVSGLVTDQNDEPLEGIEVTFLRREYDMGGIRYVRTGVTRTNDLGEYRLERRYFAGNVTALLWARRPQTQLQAMSDAPADPAMRREAVESTYFPNGVRPEEGAVIRLARGEQRENVNIRLPRSQSFCVEAQANIAGPAEDKHFLIDTLQPAFGAGRSMAMSSAKNPGRVGRDGRLLICDLPRGEYRLMIYAGNDGPPESLGVAQFAITDEDVKNLQITAQPRTPLSGTTVWASGPPAKPIEDTIYVELARLHHGFGGVIRAQPKIPEEFRLQWTVSIGGDLDNPLIDDYRVDIRLLPEGVYVKDVTYGGESVWNETLRLGSKPAGTGIEVLLAHDGGSLRAHAVDDKSEPASDVTVVLIPKKTATHMELADTRLAAITNNRGEASFDSVPPGEYWVLATGDNFMDYAVETIAALFDAKAKAEEINIGPNAAVDIEVEVQRLQR